jgi:16S rRNA G966 N2-methylase RsmD
MNRLSENDKRWIREHLSDDVEQLALHAKPDTYQKDNFRFLLTQIAAKQQIKQKLPAWYAIDDLLYPSRLPLEQCSSEITARYKASLLAGNTLLDLTGGFGVDTAFMASRFAQVTYIERQTELTEIVRNNFSVLELSNIDVRNIDGLDYLSSAGAVDAIYLDPARRSGSGKKVMQIEDCEPDVVVIQDILLQRASQALIKLSPMLDIQSALGSLKHVRQIHVVSVENECKELLFLLERAWTDEPLITCVNFRKKGDHIPVTFTRTEEKQAQIAYTKEVDNYLYEPNASLLKAGFYKGVALRYGVRKLHSDSHLYTAPELIPDFPGRIFQVETVVALNKKALKKFFSGITQAHITTRNFPVAIAELRKQWKIKEGGDVYLFATTLADGRHVIIRGAIQR